MKINMTEAERFFYEHAGYCVAQGETKKQGKTRCARELARAEAWVEAQEGLYFAWTADDSPDLSWMSDEEREQPHEVLGCCLMRKSGTFTKCDETIQSLWGIVDADRNYGRTVEAELASEALAVIEKEEKDAADCARLLQA